MGHHGPTITFMYLIQYLIVNEHLYSSVVGLDVNLKMNTKKTLQVVIKKTINNN